MSNDRLQTVDEIRAMVRAAERARARELSRLLAEAAHVALDGLKRVFAPRRIALPE